MTGTSPPGPLRCGSTTCRGNAVATPASKALPPRSRIPMPTAVAIQWVVVTTPKVPSISGRVVKVLGLILVMKWLFISSVMAARCPAVARRPAGASTRNVSGRADRRQGRGREQDVAREALARDALKVGLGGLRAVGLEVARRIEAGIPGLVLTAVSVRDQDKARRNLPQVGGRIPVVAAEALAETCDLVVECLPPAMFRSVALSVIDRGKLFMPLSVGQLLDNWDLVALAKETGARILVPTGGLIGRDAVRAAAEAPIHSVTMITRKPPNGLDGAPYLVERGISLKGLNTARKVFDGTAGRGGPGVPQNVNVAAALCLAGIGPEKTRLEISADPALDRNTHRIEVDADTARFAMSIENVPSENPRTGRIVALSTVAALRGLVSELKVGT